MIAFPAGVRVLIATKPVDFRRGDDSLAALAREELQRDPFSDVIFVFRSKRADRLKILAWETSVKAGTIFASSKLPLRVWFKAIYLVTQSKKGISSIELGRRLGVTQTAAWMMKHKLAQVMLERNASNRLKGNVQMDDAYIGGARSGRRGRGSAGKTPFVAAIATTDDGKPDQIILRPVKAFSSFAIRKFVSTALTPGANIVSDGLACFAAVTQAGCLHSSIKTGSGKQAALTPAFKWVNTALGNIKAALVGTHRTVQEKHVPRYLAEFEYRFNRRYDLKTMIPRLAFVASEDRPDALPPARTG